MPKTVLLLSGGLDSATLLAQLLDDGQEVYGLNIHYGQRHKKELDAAKSIAEHYDIKLEYLDFEVMKKLLIGSSLTDNIDVPEGHYEEENMKQTVVPNRNMVLLSIAGAWAVSLKADYVAMGAHAGDHTIYPDCRESFLSRCEDTLRHGNYHKVSIIAPFIHMSKIGIVKRGLKLEVPYKLTSTCYNGREKACGKCGSCVERLEAFEKNGVKDPLEYEE